MAVHRDPNETEKKSINEQHTKEGKVRCFVNDHPIENDTDIDYHHIRPFSLGGPTEEANLAPVCSDHHKRIGTLSILEFRARLEMEEFFSSSDPIKLDDILAVRHGKEGYGKTLKTELLSQEKRIKIFFDDRAEPTLLPLSMCQATGEEYFYIVLPIQYIKNDHQLQPRPLEIKRLWNLYRHLLTHTQLSPAICRLVNGNILLFDGQHKSAAQIWAGRKELECKIYIDPDVKRIKDTNLTAHDKLRQMPFFTSVLISKWADLHKEEWLEYIETKATKSESGFVAFLVDRGRTKADALSMIRSNIYDSILDDDENLMCEYIAERNRTRKNPLTTHALTATLFKRFITRPPLDMDIEVLDELRELERRNVIRLMNILAEETLVSKWNPTIRDDWHRLSERIYAAGSLKAWTGILRDVIAQVVGLFDSAERGKIFLREIQEEKWQVIRDRIRRMFTEHKIWTDPSLEVDNNLRVNNEAHVRGFFLDRGLTVNWILGGSGA